MAVPRARQFVALRKLCRSSHRARSAHSHGPAMYASSILAQEVPALHLSRSTATEQSQHSVRQFHTSRALRARYDESTIDFAYLPDSAAIEGQGEEILRVPILPNNFQTPSAEEEHEEVMKPEISTMSADAVFLPMADMSDGHSLNIDFHAMADRVASNLKNMKGQVAPEEQASILKQIWNDLVDDMLSARKK